MSILTMSIAVFLTQVVFIGFRTLNVKAISNDNIPMVLGTGAVIHASWLLSITLGSVSMYEVMNNFNLRYLPVLIMSLIGGLLGSYIALKMKPRKTK